MIKKTILIILTIVSFYYCMRLGYIWTAYGHGGQLLGIPIACIMMIFSLIFFSTKNEITRSRIFKLAIIYFLTIAAFSITIEIIRASMENYFEFLYYEPEGYVNEIFLGWLILGATVCFFILRKRKGIKVND